MKTFTFISPDGRTITLTSSVLIREDGRVERVCEHGCCGHPIVIVPHRYAGSDEFKASSKRMFSKHQKALRRLVKWIGRDFTSPSSSAE